MTLHLKDSMKNLRNEYDKLVVTDQNIENSEDNAHVFAEQTGEHNCKEFSTLYRSTGTPESGNCALIVKVKINRYIIV